MTEEQLQRLIDAAALAEQRDKCKHNFKGVQGTTAYLQCLKCGKRVDNDI